MKLGLVRVEWEARWEKKRKERERDAAWLPATHEKESGNGKKSLNI